MRLSSTNMLDRKMLFAAILSICASSSKKISIDYLFPMKNLHHDIFFFLILILVFVSRMLVRALWHFHEQTHPIPQRIVHGTTIEILRTIFPSLIPMFIAIPFLNTILDFLFEELVGVAECAGEKGEGTAGEPNAGSNSASGTPAAGASGTEAHSEPREPSAESSSAPSALEKREEDLLDQNVKKRGWATN